MQNKDNLALSNYVDLNNDGTRKHASWKMLVSFIILVIAYILLPKILNISKLTPFWKKDIAIAVVILVLAPFILHFSKTTKVLDNKMHSSKTRKIVNWIFLIVALPYIFSLLIVSALQVLFELPVNEILAIFFMAAMAGILEELLFRGLFFNCLLGFFYKQKYIFFISAIINSIIFGLIHFVNLAHQPLKSTIGQVIFAFAMGLILSYLRLSSNNIIWCIVVHFLNDFKPLIITSNTGSHDTSLLKVFLVLLPLIVLALISIWLYNRDYEKLNK